MKITDIIIKKRDEISIKQDKFTVYINLSELMGLHGRYCLHIFTKGDVKYHYVVFYYFSLGNGDIYDSCKTNFTTSPYGTNVLKFLNKVGGKITISLKGKLFNLNNLLDRLS